MSGILDVFTSAFLGPPKAPEIEVPEAPPPPPPPRPEAAAPPLAVSQQRPEDQAADRQRAEELARQRALRNRGAGTGIATSPLGSPAAGASLARPVLGR